MFRDVGLDEIRAEREGVMLHALLAPIELARPGARHLFLLVNGRPITDRGIARAIAFAYGDRLPPGQYPRGVVSLRLAPGEVDVNAHPQKTEVRFKRSAHLLDLITKMIAARLPAQPASDAYWEARIGASGPMIEEGHAPAPPDSLQEPRVAEPPAGYEARGANGLRFIAQVQDRAIVCESESEVLVLDRQAADALARYESLREAAQASTLSRRNLLFPDRLELEPAAEQVLERHEAILRSFGFECSHLGERSYVLRAVPALVSDAPAVSVFEAALHALRSSRSPDPDGILRAVARAAATPNGAFLDDETARSIATRIWPDRETHRFCVRGRVPLPPTPTETEDG